MPLPPVEGHWMFSIFDALFQLTSQISMIGYGKNLKRRNKNGIICIE